MEDAIKILLAKITAETSVNDVVQITQAVLNLANANAVSKN